MTMTELISSQQGLTAEYLTHRLRAIATNAVRESRLAHGRDGNPWIDDDARRLELIFEILHIAKTQEIDSESESYPLVAPQQAQPDKVLDEVEHAIYKAKAPRIKNSVEAKIENLD